MSIAQKLGRFVRMLLPVAVLLAGAFIASDLMRSSPRASRQPKARSARLVEVTPVEITRQRARVHAMGTVRAARELELRPELSGRIVRLGDELMPGGHLKAGQLVAKIDASDYELAIRAHQSEVVRARAELRLEQGRQNVAAREYQLLGGGAQAAQASQTGGGLDGTADAAGTSADTSDLALRKPQLDAVRAQLLAAEAGLERAQLDRKRTTLTAPFNAIVESRGVEIGTQVAPSSLIARLIGTDEYWVEVSVPVSQLQWIKVPRRSGESGSAVRICNDRAWGAGVCRDGEVLRQASGLEEQGRMARLLVTVRDPLALHAANEDAPKGAQQPATDDASQGDSDTRPALILGSYVRVEIEGAHELEVAVIGRNLLRDGDSVWIARADDTLEIRPVEIAFGDPERVYVADGLESGDRLIATNLMGAVAGMPIRTPASASAPAAGGP